jgi:hypothetical protein
MKKVIWTALTAAAFVLLFTAPGLAQQTATASVTATATVSAKANLAVTGAVAFADADPDSDPTIDAAALDLAVKARTSPNGSVTLTVEAGGDLTAAGGATIGIGNLTWVVSGAGFAAGTAASGSAVSVGSWTGPGAHNGTQTYRLVNSWAYATGSYSVTLTYTLTAP